MRQALAYFLPSVSSTPSLMFVDEARSLPLEWTPTRGSIRAFSAPVTGMKVTKSNKSTSLLQRGISYGQISFIVWALEVPFNPIKEF